MQRLPAGGSERAERLVGVWGGAVEQRLEGVEGEAEFGEEVVGGFLEEFDGAVVVPEGAVAPAAEALPDEITLEAVVAEDGAEVVELVGSRDEVNGLIGGGEMAEVTLLALAPRGFGFAFGIATGEDNGKDTVTEAGADGFAMVLAVVLDDIVEEGGDGFLLVGAIFEGDGGDGEQVGKVGDAALFPNLGRMRLGGVGHGFDEAGRQRHGEYSATARERFSMVRGDEARDVAAWGILCDGARRVRRSGWRVIG